MAFDDEQRAELVKMMATQFGDLLKGDDFKAALSTVVQGNIASALAGLKLDERISGAVENGTKDLRAKLEAGKGADSAGAGAGAGEPAKGGDTTSADITKHPEFMKLRESLDAVSKRADAEAKRREEAETRARQDRLESGIRDALVKAGVPGDRVQMAVAWLKTTGDIEMDDKGHISMVLHKKTSVGDYDDKKDIADAMSEWVKTPHGSVFMPATGTQGSGGTGSDRDKDRGSLKVESPDDLLNLIGIPAGV